MLERRIHIRAVFGPIWSRRGAWSMAVMAVLGLGMVLTPLLNMLGYESTALTGLASALVGPVVWMSMDPLRWSESGAASDRPSAVYLRMVGAGLWLQAPPLIAVCVAALWVPNCAPGEGVAFALLNAAASVCVCALWAQLVSVITDSIWRRWGFYLLFILTCVLSTAAFLMLEPPVRAHNPLVGFFAGSIYDEALNVPVGLIHYRVWHLLIIVAAISVLEARWERQLARTGWRQLLTSGLCLIVAVLMYGQRAELGMETDRSVVEDRLGGAHHTEHFIIHYPLETWHSAQIEAIGQDHEFRYAQLLEAFGREPLPAGEKIRSYIYADAAQKGALLGMRRTMIARVWLGEIHILYRAYGQPVLMHELVHIFSAPFGTGPLKLAMDGPMPNMGLVEGLAEAVTWRSGDLTPHAWSGAMRKLKIAPDIRGILGAAGFYARSGARSYTLMGSFCRHLIDLHGIEKFLKVYSSGDFESVYGEPVDNLVTEWETFVDAIDMGPQELGMAEFYLDRRSIFEKKCARAVAALRVEGFEKVKRRRLTEALECFEEAVSFSPRTARYRLDLVDLLLKIDRDQEARLHLQAVLAEPEISRMNLARALEAEADLLARGGAVAEAAETYQEVLGLNPRLARRRSAQAKMAALTHDLGRKFFFGARPPALRSHTLFEWHRGSPDSALAAYMLGRHLWGKRSCAQALPYLRSAVEGGRPLPGKALRGEALRLMGICLFDGREYTQSQEVFEKLIEERLFEGQRLEAEDWIRRIKWAQGTL